MTEQSLPPARPSPGRRRSRSPRERHPPERAIVLTTNPLRDNDLIAALLCESQGRASAVAYRVRGSTKRYLGGLEPFDHVEITLDRRPGDDLFVIRDIRQREVFRQLREDLDAFLVASLVTEIAYRFFPEGDAETVALYPLLARTLKALDRRGGREHVQAIGSYFMLEAFRMQGVDILEHEYAANLTEEARSWAASMLTEQRPTLPQNRTLLPQVLRTLCRYSAGPLGTSLNSERSIEW